MQVDRAALVFAALGHSTRISALQLLAGEADGLPAGEIGRRLGIPQNLMSSHLRTLAAAGLVQGRRLGRTVVYGRSGASLDELALFLAGV